MSNELAIPDYLKGMIEEGTVQDQTAGMVTGAESVPRVSTKGKTFRLKKDGEETLLEGNTMDVIIVGMNPEHGLAHTYYKDGWSPDSTSPPDCSSFNGATPDPWISAPQNDNCAKCPQAVWGSATSMSGGKAKACRDSKHLFVAVAKEFANDPENCTLYLLQVTVNSLKNFSNFAKELAAKGLPGPQFVVTTVHMVADSSVPQLDFSIRGVLNEKLGKPAHTRNQKKEWDMDVISRPALPSGQNKQALPEHVPQTEEATPTPPPAESDESIDDLLDDWN